MNTNFQETIRIGKEDAIALKSICVAINVSQYKSNWIKLLTLRDEPIVNKLKQAGAIVTPRSTSMFEIHVSLTKLTNKELMEIGLVVTAEKFAMDYAPRLTDTILTHFEIKKVREGLFSLAIYNERFFVLGRKEEEVLETMQNVVKHIYMNSVLWTKWVATSATFTSKDGKDIIKFENGLSVLMNLEAYQYCQTLHNGEAIEHATIRESYWWLTRFF